MTNWASFSEELTEVYLNLNLYIGVLQLAIVVANAMIGQTTWWLGQKKNYRTRFILSISSMYSAGLFDVCVWVGRRLAPLGEREGPSA